MRLTMWNSVNLILYFSCLQLSSCLIVKKGYFWQVTDIHFDGNYSIYGDSKKMCHKTGSAKGDELSSYGNYLCDSPWPLVKSAVNAMKSIHPNPDFILWSGDSVPHVDTGDLDTLKVILNVGNVTRLLRETFAKTPIYPVLGNHDEFPAHQFPGGTTDYYQRILKVGEFDTLLSKDTAEQFTTGGYYTTLTKTGIRIISLNSNMYYDEDKLTANIDDPGQQFKWLKKTLLQARADNEKVILQSHVAPGLFERYSGMMWFYQKFNQRYLDILREFSDVIVTQMYGHQHADSYRVLTDSYGKPVSVLYLSPAVTPWNSSLEGVGSNNPGIRLYTYNQHNGEIINFQQYFLNLSAAIISDTVTWALEYDAHQVYGIQTFDGQSFYDLTKSFLPGQDSSLFNKYITYNTVSKELDPVCDVTCQRVHYCSIMELELSGYNQCLSGFQTTSFPRRTTRQHPANKPVPHYYIYIIGGLGALVFILFIIVAVLCIKKRKHLIPHRYSKFSNTLKKGPIN